MRGLRALAAATGCLSLLAAGVVVSNPADADTEFTFGTGFAQASMLVPSLSAGELSIPIILGESAAGYQDETGRATSTYFNVPLLGATSSTSVTCGVKTDSAVPIPDPLSADTSSTQNKKPVDKAEAVPFDGLVEQEVHAAPNASGRSRTQLADVGLPGVVELGGVTAEALTAADPKQQLRRAEATTRVSDVKFFGGFIRLTGMRWSLVQTSKGADSRTAKRDLTKSFTFDGIVIDPAAAVGIPVPPLFPKVRIPVATPEGAAAATKTANRLLEPLGLTFELPTFVDNGVGRVQMTSFNLKIGGPNWVLTPVLGGVISRQEIVELQGQLFKALLEPDCAQFFGLLAAIPELNARYNSLGGTVPLLAAASMGVLSGGGALISIGGVTTSLDDTYFPPLLFGTPEFMQAPGDPGEPAIPGSQSTVSPRLREVGGATSAISSQRGTCETTSPAGAPRCWRGLATHAAAAAALVAVGSMVADEVLTRRRMRRLSESEVA